MTNIGKENIIRKIKGSNLFDDFDGAEEYIISLIKKDMNCNNGCSERDETDA